MSNPPRPRAAMLGKIMTAIGVPTLLLSASIFAADDVDVSGDWELTLQTEADAMKPR